MSGSFIEEGVLKIIQKNFMGKVDRETKALLENWGPFNSGLNQSGVKTGAWRLY